MKNLSLFIFFIVLLPLFVFAQREPLDTLSGIVVGDIRFESARVEDVVTALVRASREHDPRGIGVNMVLVSHPPVEGEAPSLPSISMELREVSLLQVLDLVTERAGLRYHVDRNIVIIGRTGNTQMETRFYPVDPTLFTERTRMLQRK